MATKRKIPGSWQRCDFQGCTTTAHFNLPGLNVRSRCSVHKEVGMIDNIHPTCYEGCCMTQPVFNFPAFQGDPAGIRCFAHKLEGMVDVVHPLCQEGGCTRKACCHYPGSVARVRCREHKLEGMIGGPRDCEENGCNKIPSFNFPGMKLAVKCTAHKSEAMVDVLHPCCQEKECTKRANFSFHGQRPPIRCSMLGRRVDHNIYIHDI